MTGTRTDGSSTVASPGSGDRLVFVDVLRVAVIVLVVAFHAAQPYGPTGGEWPVTDPANSELLRPSSRGEACGSDCNPNCNRIPNDQTSPDGQEDPTTPGFAKQRRPNLTGRHRRG